MKQKKNQERNQKKIRLKRHLKNFSNLLKYLIAMKNIYQSCI